MNNINVVIDKDTNGFNGVYIYDEVTNRYIKGDKELRLQSELIKFVYSGSQYYWRGGNGVDFSIVLNKTTQFEKYSGGFTNVTITEIQNKKRSRRGNKTKWI